MAENKVVHSNFTFNQYLIGKSLFEVNQSFDPTDEVPLDFNLKTDFHINDDKDEALVVLICEIFKDYKENNFPFYMYVEIVGNFSLEGEVENDFIEMCKINGTAILFPYLRSYVSFVTSMSGVSTLILPTVNVMRMLEKSED